MYELSQHRPHYSNAVVQSVAGFISNHSTADAIFDRGFRTEDIYELLVFWRKRKHNV